MTRAASLKIGSETGEAYALSTGAARGTRDPEATECGSMGDSCAARQFTRRPPPPDPQVIVVEPEEGSPHFGDPNFSIEAVSRRWKFDWQP